MAWLVTEDARVLASAEVADSRATRRRGLLGRDHLDGAIVLSPCRWVHTIGMQFPIDVAFLDQDGVVVKTMQMRQRRIGVPVWHARLIVEAEAGAFARWGLRVGDVVSVRPNDEHSNDDRNDDRDTDDRDTDDRNDDHGAFRHDAS
ncbi:MAG TPA: DUF192 domain-containing protein [Ilumatobacter sp.]|nr:DUF192 domain-containing protein [Ilumatobacter sp.]